MLHLPSAQQPGYRLLFHVPPTSPFLSMMRKSRVMFWRQSSRAMHRPGEIQVRSISNDSTRQHCSTHLRIPLRLSPPRTLQHVALGPPYLLLRRDSPFYLCLEYREHFTIGISAVALSGTVPGADSTPPRLTTRRKGKEERQMNTTNDMLHNCHTFPVSYE